MKDCQDASQSQLLRIHEQARRRLRELEEIFSQCPEAIEVRAAIERHRILLSELRKALPIE